MIWQWLSCAGLVIELCGFVLMAADLLPELRLSRRRRLLEDLGNMVTPDWGRRREPAIEDPLGQALQDLTRELANNDLRKLLKKAGARPPHSMEYVPIRSAMSDAEVELQEASAALDRRWRPPLRTAIVLVVIGAVVQFLGSVPATARCDLLQAMSKPLAEGLEACPASPPLIQRVRLVSE